MKILTKPEKSLSKSSSPVETFDKELQDFCKKLLKKTKQKSGLGMAAPQVGTNVRVICAKVLGKLTIMVNPTYTSMNNIKVKSFEGCFSVPGVVAEVPRFPKVKVTYQTMYGKQVSHNLQTTEAFCVQHECDHLDGLLIDRWL